MATERLNNKYMKMIAELMLKDLQIGNSYHIRRIAYNEVRLASWDKNMWKTEGRVLFNQDETTASIYVGSKSVASKINITPYAIAIHAFLHGYAFDQDEYKHLLPDPIRYEEIDYSDSPPTTPS